MCLRTFVTVIVLNMQLARIYDSMLIELNIYLKRPLVSSCKVLDYFGGICIYLAKRGSYCSGILNKIVIHKLIKINSWNIEVISNVWQV